MDNKKDYTLMAMVGLLVFGLLYLIISNPVDSNMFVSPFQGYHPQPSKQSDLNRYKDALEAALVEASMENKTLIIAMVNKAYVDGDKSMLDIFLDGFWLGEDTRGLVNHLLLVTTDQTSYERCKFLRLHCYRLETDGVDFEGEKFFMSEDFNKMMWRRTLFLWEVLKRGYSFVFTDTDVLWLRNPFPSLRSNESIDLQISTDYFNGEQWSESNPINTGFYMINSSSKTISLFKLWYGMKDNLLGQKEQDVLYWMLHKGVSKMFGLKIKFLDTLYFSGFCQESKDFLAVKTVHANCCRTIGAKITDLMVVIHDWMRFKNSTDNYTSTYGWTGHVACANSWK